MKKSFKLATIALSLIAGVSVVSIPFVHAGQQMEEGVVYNCNEDGTLTPVPHVEGNYAVNENGQTYGVSVDSPYIEDVPDLQLAEGDNGITGYVYTYDLIFKDMPANPEEAVAMMEARAEAKANGTYEPKVINVYESDGVTVIDTFTETVSQ
ncbi:MAG: hypothetical protein K2K16_13245 [Ruminococcus sp.]|nr:hypothetical protein [Ruminococcus sp.]